MTRPARRGPRWPDALILSIAAVLAFEVGRRADRECLRLEPASEVRARSASRPDWVWAMEYPSRRILHDWSCLPAVATLAATAILARDRRTWTRRGLRRPGTVVIVTSMLVGGLSVAHRLAVGPLIPPGLPITYELKNILDYWIPGAIIGARVVARLAPSRRAGSWPGPGWRISCC